MVKLLSVLKALLTLGFLVCSVNGLAQPLEKISVQFHWLEQFEFAGFYIAKEKGFYAKAGLDVTFLPHKIGETSVVNNVLSGKAQYGVNYSSLIQNYHNQQPVVALAAILQNSPLVLMSLESSKILTPEDLKGKKIMIGGDALNSAPIMALLFSHGLVRSDITRLKHSHNIDDLINGKTDSMTAFISNEPFKMTEKGHKFRIFDPKKSNLSFYENLLFTSENELLKHPERVKAFVKASLQGWNYAFEHIDETAKLLQNKHNEQNKSFESLVYEGKELKKLAYDEGLPLGNLSLRKLEKIEDAYRLMGINLSNKKITDFIWEEARPRTDQKTIFTPIEQDFIQHTVVKAATTTNWAPFSFVNRETGRVAGIGYDFWNEIANTAGLKSHITQFESFANELNSLKNKTHDVIYSAGITEDRKKYSLFSNPYASFPVSIATSKEEHFIQNINQLKDKKIAVGRNFTAHKMMQSAFPDLGYIPVDNAREGLQKVSNGEAYAYVDIMPNLSHSINLYGFTNLKISGNTGLMFDLRIMIRDDFPELLSITNKVILNMHPDKKQEILNKWINVQYQQVMNITQYWPQATIILIVIITLLLWMQRSKKIAQLANQSKSEFLASMSHEIRTPMTSIIGYADLLLDDKLPKDSREKILRIKDSTNSLLHLLNDILDMSKMEAGKMEIEKIDFDLQKLISDIVIQADKTRLSDKPVSLQIDYSANFPSAINSDPKRIRQILVNFLGNAVKFTHEGSISIVGSVTTNQQGTKMLKIAVQDTGIGMSIETMNKIFSTFTQADASISRKFEGSGLGLAICKRLVKLLDGDLGVDSKEGKGSIFWFSLPYIEASQKELPIEDQLPKVEQYSAVRQLNILLAEDNRVNQLVIRKLLEKYGHKVSIAENGMEAVSNHQLNSYDLILMDIRMPEMNGLEATRIIRKMPGDKSITPIIAVTADVMKESVSEYLASGMNLCVSKPIDINEILQAINQVLNENIHVPS